MLQHVPEISADALSILIEVLLPCCHPNPSEHFDPQSPPRNSPNHIHSVLLTPDKVSPGIQDVPPLFYVNIVLDPVDVGLKGLFKVALHAISFEHRFSQLSCHFGLFQLLLCLLLLALTN